MFLLLTATVLLASCMKSDDTESTLYKDTAITAFSLGTLERTMHATAKDGSDSTYTVKVTGSDYKFSIDQANHRIFNADSLPANTDVSRVLCSVGTLNNGVVLVQDLEDSDLLIYYSANDSIDFSTPRKFLVYATDGSTHEEYTVQVNVHKEEGDQFRWAAHAKSEELTSLDKMKALMLNGQLFVYGSKEGKTLGFTTTDGDTWTALAELEDAEAYRQMVVLGKELYTIAGGSLMSSADGMTWTVVNETLDVVQLVATSHLELYGLSSDYYEMYGLTSDGTMLLSEDKGVSWKEDILDTDKSWLPSEGIAFVCYPAQMTYYTDYLLLAGVSAGVKDISSVWRKIVEYDLLGDEKWVYIDRTDDNAFALPQLEGLSLIYYGDGILAWGIKDGAFAPIYQSRDNGIVWKKNRYYQMPETFTEGGACAFGVATDGKEIWLVGGNGQVWQGHMNKVAWDKPE